MHFLTVASLIISLHISVTHATCNKTNSLIKNDDPDGNTQTGINNQTIRYDLDSLRVEYYKYKILSHLGMTGNPDDRPVPEVYHDSITLTEEEYNIKNNNFPAPVNVSSRSNIRYTKFRLLITSRKCK